MSSFATEDIALALDRGEMTPFFQPQIDLETGQIIAAEALSRWMRAGELVMPSDYIEIAERSGVICDIDLRMMRLAIESATRWRARGIDVGLSINVSIVTLSASAWARELLDHVADSGMPAELVTVEVTESRRVSEFENVVGELDALAKRGVAISIDDFGAGYADAHSLEMISASELKLDRSLLQGDLPPAAAAARLAHDRGLRLVAEGVETAEHEQRAVDLGCHRAQGFHFSPAVPSREFAELASQ